LNGKKFAEKKSFGRKKKIKPLGKNLKKIKRKGGKKKGKKLKIWGGGGGGVPSWYSFPCVF